MNKNHARTAVLTSIAGLILGLVDTMLQFVLTTVNLGWISNPGCSAGGCFTSLNFRTYWGVTNMILGFFGVIFTLIFIYDLKKFKFKNFKSIQERNRFKNANRLALAILISSTFLIIIPSAVVGLLENLGFDVFKIVGPFYTLCLVCAGVSNSIIETTHHVEIKKAANEFFNKKKTLIYPIASITPP